MISSARPAWRTKSVESILCKIPDVSSATLHANGGANSATAAVMRALTASVSTPSLVAQERARASAREKMTPNLDLENDDNNDDDDDDDDALLIGGERVVLSECFDTFFRYYFKALAFIMSGEFLSTVPPIGNVQYNSTSIFGMLPTLYFSTGKNFLISESSPPFFLSQ